MGLKNIKGEIKAHLSHHKGTHVWLLDMILLSAVYAVGLYVDPKAAKHLLSNKQADISAKQGIPEQAVFDGMNITLPGSVYYID